MTIIFFTRLFHPHIGGVETHVQEISKLLAKNHTVHIITEQYVPELPVEDKIDGFKIWRIPFPKYVRETQKKWIIWKWLQNHQDLINSADVLHAHDVHFWLWPYKLTHPRRKTYVTFHGWEGTYPIPTKNKLIRKLSENIATGNICVGDYITKWYGTHPNSTIYGAVSPSNNISAPGSKLLFWGRLAKDTGFEEFLKFAKLLPFKKGDVVIAGDGPLRTMIPPEYDFKGFSSDRNKLIGQSKYVFCTGYLGMLDAFARKRLVLSTYQNPVKEDYLRLHPMSGNMTIAHDAIGLYEQLSKLLPAVISAKVQSAYTWSKQQTWHSVVNSYKTLWSI
jgi:glycosyltransferase involved in cell wall biosynthesis